MKEQMSFCRLLISALLVAVPHAFATADAPPTAQLDHAIEYLERGGTEWIEQRDCVSCHQVPAMLWSLSVAEESGLELDTESLRRWSQWSTDPVHFVADAGPDFDPQKTMQGNIDTMSALLLAIPREKDTDTESKDDQSGNRRTWRRKFTKALIAEQRPDGSWNPCGQLPLQKRPKDETSRVTTLWVTLALVRHQATDFDQEAAMRFIDSGDPARSTEWYAARLLLASQQQSDKVTEYRRLLLDKQKPDGGWGWIVDQDSDALATGLALYALSVSHTESNERVASAVDRGREFLIRTQTQDGSWKVPGTKSASAKRATETSNYWGTAWAIIGLLSAQR
ncbi:terpene cyclase/mutase family protein [Roseiconus nitratireducens]|uniref:Terpene cyclase/mutase family protein n=1 Tax=Roseiconus nitratireducens TaxID=2605748 RepID=A0A5M6CV71_9BACT|nr:prenyltransferase/squalene oxidase repeat-containing protein [Roseiconus nitratireducens]KAA5539091.1 terpene cyclase/mutase family protein [Roseiconus nitratireducens]